jgi:hypothetical protein
MAIFDKFKDWRFSTSFVAGLTAAFASVWFPPAAAFLAPYVSSLAGYFSFAGANAIALALGTITTGVFFTAGLAFGVMATSVSGLFNCLCGSNTDSDSDVDQHNNDGSGSTNGSPNSASTTTNATNMRASTDDEHCCPLISKLFARAPSARVQGGTQDLQSQSPSPSTV